LTDLEKLPACFPTENACVEGKLPKVTADLLTLVADVKALDFTKVQADLLVVVADVKDLFTCF
jgi:hypothetical protein